MDKQKKWVQYDSAECPKCGMSVAAKVLTRSTEYNLVYDGEEVRCFNCQHTGSISVEDSECADVIWDVYDTNVGDMKSNKSAEEICKLMVDECPFVIRPSVEPYIIEAMKLYAASLQSRITQLENALLKVRDRHIKNPITYNIITKALNNEI